MIKTLLSASDGVKDPVYFEVNENLTIREYDGGHGVTVYGDISGCSPTDGWESEDRHPGGPFGWHSEEVCLEFVEVEDD